MTKRSLATHVLVAAIAVTCVAVLDLVPGPSPADAQPVAAGYNCHNSDTGDQEHQIWLARNWCLYPGDRVHSEFVSIPIGYRRMTFVYQSDGNLVLYRSIHESWSARSEPLWALNRVDPGWNAQCRREGKLAMQVDGNLVLYDCAGRAVWESNTWRCDHPASLAIQGDGNAVIYQDNSGAPLWKIEGFTGSARPPRNARIHNLAC